MMDLTALEYPRHLHKPEGAYLRVNTVAEAAIAVAEGWHVSPNCDDAPPAAPEVTPEPERPKGRRK